MSSALQLTATATILNGQGLAENSALMSAISRYQALPTVAITANIFVTAAANIDLSDPYLGTALSNLGTGITNNTYWMLDYYPANTVPVCSTNLGYVFQSNISASLANIANIASVSRTVTNQATVPFASGMSGFANVFTTVYGYTNSVFDTVGSIYMLQGKTYAQSGIGYRNPTDLSTIGIGQAAPLISDTVLNWGTMYDVTRLNLIGDPYVFGQNLLNQGLGSYGNLSVNLTAAGLDINDITAVPVSTTTTKQTASVLTVHSLVGSVDLPTLTNVVTTNTVTAISPDVVVGIYRNVTGSDLSAIIAATGITVPVGSQITSLADFLTLTNVIDSALVPQYANLGIYSLNDVGSYIHQTLGAGYFPTWASIATTLEVVVIPTFASNITDNTTGSSLVLSSSTISTLQNYISSGTGPFNNPIMSDFLGATAGMNYTSDYQNIISYYNTINPSLVVAALNTLSNDVTTYVNAMPGSKSTLIAAVNSAVSAVNATLNALGNTTPVTQASTVFNDVTTKLALEVSNLNKAGVVFDSGSRQGLFSFAQTLSTLFSDNVKIQTTQFGANLITNDAYGDTIRAAIAETTNTQALQKIGIQVHNDPAPSQAVELAQAQNIPLSTYLSQNK